MYLQLLHIIFGVDLPNSFFKENTPHPSPRHIHLTVLMIGIAMNHKFTWIILWLNLERVDNYNTNSFYPRLVNYSSFKVQFIEALYGLGLIVRYYIMLLCDIFQFFLHFLTFMIYNIYFYYVFCYFIFQITFSSGYYQYRKFCWFL